MSNGILIVEHPGSLAECGEYFILQPQELAQAHRVSWKSFVPQQLRAGQNRLVIVNAIGGSEEAAAFFQWLLENPIPVPIFAILPLQNGPLLQAAAETVDDFLLWPVRHEELNKRIMRLLGTRSQESRDAEACLAAEVGLRQLVGRDPAFLKIVAQIAMFAGSNAPVLFTGETGTGKELCARLAHLLSKRQQGPFIPVDCGALPDHLFENEVFGHVRGAFTDARSDQKGLVALAQHGTLFLDEIDSLSAGAQNKILRLLQERTYRPLGSERFSDANVRIVAATNRDLEQAVEQKQFRTDLFFRINVLRVRLPALRERRGDVHLLSRHFIEEICSADGIPRKVLSQAAAHKLEQYDWPGNVRELHNTIQRAVLYSPGTQIAASSVDLTQGAEVAEGDLPSFRKAKLNAIAAFERDYVRQMMEKTGGNVTRAAREAGKDRRAFGRLARKYGLRAAAG